MARRSRFVYQRLVPLGLGALVGVVLAWVAITYSHLDVASVNDAGRGLLDLVADLVAPSGRAGLGLDLVRLKIYVAFGLLGAATGAVGSYLGDIFIWVGGRLR